jgi:hypothetical protein
MVRIPDIYTPSVGLQPGGQPEVQAQRVVPFQDPTGQMIAQMGAGVSAMGEGVMRVENQIDNARTKEAESLLADFAVEELTTYRAMAGKAAVDGYKPLNDRLAKRRQEAEKMLQNDTQRSMFRMAADRRMRSYQQALQSHYLDQVKVWDGAQNKARMQQFASEALLARDSALAADGPENPYSLAKGGIEVTIRDQAGLLQIPVSQDPKSPYQQYRKQVLSEMHESVLDAFKDQPAKAKAYLDKAVEKGELLPAVANKYQGAIKDKETNDAAFGQFQQWRTQNLTAPQMAQQLDEMLQAGKVDAEVYDRLEQRINRYEVAEHRREQRDIRETRQAVTDWWTKAQSTGAAYTALAQAGVTPAAPGVMIWEDVPLELRQRAEATGQGQELRRIVNSGMMFNDTAQGIRVLQSLRTDPSSLLDREWSEIENALRFDMSNESLETVATMHSRIHHSREVELEKAAEAEKKRVEQARSDNQTRSADADKRIDALLDNIYDIRKVSASQEQQRSLELIKQQERSALRAEAISFYDKPLDVFDQYLARQKDAMVLATIQDQQIPMRTTTAGELADLNVVSGISFGIQGEDGKPLNVGSEVFGALQVPGKAEAQPVIERFVGKQQQTIHQMVQQFNQARVAEGKPEMQLRTTVSPTYVYALQGRNSATPDLMQYLEHKRQIAGELATSADMKESWIRMFGQAEFNGSIERFATIPATAQRAYNIRQKAIKDGFALPSTSQRTDSQRAASDGFLMSWPENF